MSIEHKKELLFNVLSYFDETWLDLEQLKNEITQEQEMNIIKWLYNKNYINFYVEKINNFVWLKWNYYVQNMEEYWVARSQKIDTPLFPITLINNSFNWFITYLLDTMNYIKEKTYLFSDKSILFNDLTIQEKINEKYSFKIQ